MKLHRSIRVQKLQDKNRMVGQTFNVLEKNERRKLPWLGSAWYTKEELETGVPDEVQDAKRKERYAQWERETERLLKSNPNLKII
jgi:hypothetical protein